MIFTGISSIFDLANEQQYDTIGQFWDEMAAIYGLENLQGLGYCWQDGYIAYAIGLKDGCISGYNLQITLPDEGWSTIDGETDRLPEIYRELYKSGPLQYEIETFFENGKCRIAYYRSK